MDKVYTIIGGINGVGKSSFIGARNIENRIDVDKIAAEQGVSNIEAGRIALKMIDEFLEKGEPFAQETTLSGRRILKTIARAKELGYKIELYYIGVDTVEESLERIRNRVRRGGHAIAENDVRRRFAARFDVLKEVLPICDKTAFYDNNNGFRLISLFENKPKWFVEIVSATNLDFGVFGDCPRLNRTDI